MGERYFQGMRTQIGRILFATMLIGAASVASSAPLTDASTVCHSTCAAVWAPGTGPAADAADDALYAAGYTN